MPAERICTAVPNCGATYTPNRKGATKEMCPRCYASARRHGGIPQPRAFPSGPPGGRPVTKRDIKLTIDAELLDAMGDVVPYRQVSAWVEGAIRARLRSEGGAK